MHSNPDFDIELSFVGGCFNGSAQDCDLNEVMDLIDPEMLQSSKLSSVYSACCRIFKDSKKAQVVDEISVYNDMQKDNSIKSLGDNPRHYLWELAQCGAWSGVNLLHYGKIIIEKYKQRRINDLSLKIAQSARNSGEAINNAEIELRAISQYGDEKKITSSKESIMAQFKELEKLAQAKKIEGIIKTGFYDLDKLINGFLPADFVLLGGRPSMGKTALAIAMAINISKRNAVLFFSLEMNKESLTSRMLSSESGVDAELISSPWNMQKESWSKIVDGSERLYGLNMNICDDTRITTSQMKTLIEKANRKNKIGIVVIDYLQLIRSNGKSYSREREVAEISADLKAIAKDFNIPVLCLAQLNRTTEATGDKRPKLSNLRESGSLEQDADKVLFIHREHYYNRDANSNEAEILVAKNRTGAGSGERIIIGWDASKTKFYNKTRG